MTLPSPLAEIANRIAAEQHWTLSEAVIFLVKRGVKAQQEAEQRVAMAHEDLVNADPSKREEAENNLIRAIFGPESLA